MNFWAIIFKLAGDTWDHANAQLLKSISEFYTKKVNFIRYFVHSRHPFYFCYALRHVLYVCIPYHAQSSICEPDTNIGPKSPLMETNKMSHNSQHTVCGCSFIKYKGFYLEFLRSQLFPRSLWHFLLAYDSLC